MRHVCAFMIASIALCAQGAEAQTILRVDCTASDPAPDGSTWSKAYVHLQDALTAASGIAAPGSPVQIWVAACAYMPDGAYTPPAGIHTPGSGDQVATFQLADDVEIYGGFPSGGGDGTFDARDPAVHITTLSGDLNADDVGGFETVVASDDWASATPITEGRTVFDTTDATIWVPGDGIDGQDVWFLYTASCTGTLAIRGTFGFGVAVYEESFGLPGALLASDDAGYVPFSVDVTATNSYLIRVGAANEKSGPGFIDLTCESDNTGDNSAHVVTGGGTNGSAVLDGCTISGGSATDDNGAGMLNIDGSPTVNGCTFSRNWADLSGGGMYNANGDPTVTDCVFSGNSAWNRSDAHYSLCHGGGIHNEGADTIMERCTFTGNLSPVGGAVHNDSNSPAITDCTFTYNTASSGAAVYLEEAATPTVSNCTFANNAANGGTAITVFGTDHLAVTDSSFTNNWAYSTAGTGAGGGAEWKGGGGAVFNAGTRTQLLRCRFVSNRARYQGGALNSYAEAGDELYDGTDTQIEDCVFIGNISGFYRGICGGGAIANQSRMQYPSTTTMTITGCVFCDNLIASNGDSGGGAIFNNRGDVVVTDCLFTGNGSTEFYYVIGGAIYSHTFSYAGSASLLNCAFSGNPNPAGWGTVHLAEEATVTNCIFVGNEAGPSDYTLSQRGGAVANCTLVANSGKGLGLELGGTATNCILWGNFKPGSPPDGDSQGGRTANYSCIQGLSSYHTGVGNISDAPAFVGGPGGVWTAPATYDPATGQTTFTDTAAGLTADEMVGSFLNPNATQALQASIVSNTATTITTWGNFSALAAAGTEAYQANDYRLSPGSPCIDAGDNTADTQADVAGIQPLPAVDLDGHMRIVDDPVTPDTGNPPGASAIVDMGAYEFGSGSLPSRLYVDADAAPGANGTSWADALTDLQNALTAAAVADGAVNEIWVAAGTYTPAPPLSHPDSRARLFASFQLVDGVAVYGGFAGHESSLAERNLTDPANETILSGDLDGDDASGGSTEFNSRHVVSGSGTNATAVLDGFTITAGNASAPVGTEPFVGGGMKNRKGHPTARNCLFIANHADYGGGMANTAGSNPTVVNCTFRANGASEGGAGMANLDGSSPAVINCVFVASIRHPASVGSPLGGGIMNEYSSPFLANCTITQNWGRGAYNRSSDLTAVNCIFWGNFGGRDQIYNENSTATVTYSCIQDRNPDDADIPFGGSANGNIDDDPLLDTAGDLQLLPGSPAVDAGDNTAVPADLTDLDGDGDTDEPVPFDVAGRPRLQDDPDTTDTGNGTPPIVDMGAHELPGLPRLLRIVGGSDAADGSASWVWPKAEDVRLAACDIEADQPVTYVGSSVVTTDGSGAPAVSAFTHVAGGVHRIDLDGPIPVGHWTIITLTVAGATGVESTFEICLGHLPDDINGDGQVNMNDVTAFGSLFNAGPGAPERDRIDVNGDGQANLNDATVFGQLWNGTSGHGAWQYESLPPMP